MRSLLFVPADNPKKLEKALGCGADALVLDLEDSVAHSKKPSARQSLRGFLRARAGHSAGPKILVRVNALGSPDFEADLDALAENHPPEGIVLPKCVCGADVQRLGALLAVLEAQRGLPDGSTGVLPIATESGEAMFGISTYAGSSRRLLGLAWGAEDLSADLGAESNRDDGGNWREPYRLARSLLLYGAAAASTDAIDTVFGRLGDERGLRQECEQARRDGFVGKLAVHPDQVSVINAAFTPSAEALTRARRIVAAFAAEPESGVIALDGEMIDRLHLRRAERLLRRGAAYDSTGKVHVSETGRSIQAK